MSPKNIKIQLSWPLITQPGEHLDRLFNRASRLHWNEPFWHVRHRELFNSNDALGLNSWGRFFLTPVSICEAFNGPEVMK